jgi:hypothetical protein
MDFFQGLGALCEVLNAIIALGNLFARLSSPETSKTERILVTSLMIIAVFLCGAVLFTFAIQQPQQREAARIAAAKTQTQAFSGELGRVRTAVQKHLVEWQKIAKKDHSMHRLTPAEADLGAEPGIKAIDYGYCEKYFGDFFLYVWKNFDGGEHSGADMVGYAYNDSVYCRPDDWVELRQEYWGDSWSSIEFMIRPPTKTPVRPATAAF